MKPSARSATAREPVRLPAMPAEREAASAYPPIALERGRVVDGHLVFATADGFARALTHGFMLVEVPDGVDTGPGDLFAGSFYTPRSDDALRAYRGYREVPVPGSYQGYFDRQHDQWENFYIEASHWDMLPPPVALLGQQMAGLGVTILRDVLAYLELPESDWEMVTGGLSENQGHQMLAFNHFRPEKQVRGSKFHRDSGWVTILRSVEPGLLALIDGSLWAIHPQPGCFIANFGSSIEVLTQRLPHPVRANIHGVVQTERAAGQPDRTSYVVFLDSRLDGTLYRYEEGRPRPLQSMAEFASQEVNRTYDGENSAL